MNGSAITYLFTPHSLGIKCSHCDTCYHIQRKGNGKAGPRIRAAARQAGWTITADEVICRKHG